MTCIGNSGPLSEPVSEAIEKVQSNFPTIQLHSNLYLVSIMIITALKSC